MATIFAFAASGYDGELVTVEVDLRRGIPGLDMVGLPDGAVRESRERVRVAVRNSGFSFPQERILISLAPAGLRKEGALFDLPIAIAILAASGQIPLLPHSRILILGELELSGKVRPVRGVLSAVHCGIRNGCDLFIVPRENANEAGVLALSGVLGVASLAETSDGLCAVFSGLAPSISGPARERQSPSDIRISGASGTMDIGMIRGQPKLKRALEIAAAGRHHLFFLGPPGVGKTMSARALPSVLPDLARDESIEVTRLYSMAGLLPDGSGLLTRPPFRSPHHGASAEGIIGGGASVKPGEISLAHKGVLFLDEAPEFRKDILQSLREPLEDKEVTVSRAGRSVRLPSHFQLVLAANPCPCGNLGKTNAACVCSDEQISSYWKRLGGALLDRVDLQVAAKPSLPGEILGPGGEDAGAVLARVSGARALQYGRLGGCRCNADMHPDEIERYTTGRMCSARSARIMALSPGSARLLHSVLKVARTIADLDGGGDVKECHLDEALTMRCGGLEKILEIFAISG